ncbi:MAG: YbaB/EbfC family nucleoid-associated protein [Streptococcaceae bacterium]|jgi:DNA-binding YbaB/EbfC family protein|nr:YbaB/EbfC family nucleoid-associated protein [Streptococcaceae bacterium]
MHGMGNMQQMMKQAQKLQKQMLEAQETLAKQDFLGVSTNEYVKATFSGDKQLKTVEFHEDVVDPEDTDLLSDMVVMAVNDALSKIDAASEKTMGKFGKGLPF